MQGVSDAMGALFGALALTVAIEAAVAWPLGLRTGFEQAVLALLNVITNPALTLTLALLGHFQAVQPSSPAAPAILALEALVVALETLGLRLCLRRRWARCLALSAACNFASWLAGAILLWS